MAGIKEKVERINEIYGNNFNCQTKVIRKAIKEFLNKKITITADFDKSFSIEDPYTFFLDWMGRGSQKDFGKEAKDAYVKNKLGAQIKLNCDYAENLYLGIPDVKRVKTHHLEKEKETYKYHQNFDDLRKSFLRPHGENKEIPEKLDTAKLAKFISLFDKPDVAPTTFLYCLWPEYFVPYDKYTKKYIEKLKQEQKKEQNLQNCDYTNIFNNIKLNDAWKLYFEDLECLYKIFNSQQCKLPQYVSIALSFLAYVDSDNVLESVFEDIRGGKEGIAKNIVFTGIPGTGKTHTVVEFLKKAKEDKNSRIADYAFVQFHPSYDYEDFIEGMKPVPSNSTQSGNSALSFELVDGVFKELCKRAYKDKNNYYVMVVDEINRADLSRVFGELLYCLEYRDEFVDTKFTSYIKKNKSKENSFEEDHNDQNFGRFIIPSNVLLIGTMNDVDRSIDAFDMALRRRFRWEEVTFNKFKIYTYEKFKEQDADKVFKLINRAENLNKAIEKDMGGTYTLGHTYFFKVADYWEGTLEDALEGVWVHHIRSLLREYLKMHYDEKQVMDKLDEYRKILIEEKG